MVWMLTNASILTNDVILKRVTDLVLNELALCDAVVSEEISVNQLLLYSLPGDSR